MISLENTHSVIISSQCSHSLHTVLKPWLYLLTSAVVRHIGSGIKLPGLWLYDHREVAHPPWASFITFKMGITVLSTLWDYCDDSRR